MSDRAPVMLVGVRDGERDGEDGLCEWNGWVGGLGGRVGWGGGGGGRAGGVGKVGLGEGEVGTDDEAWWLEDRLGVMYLEWGRY